MATYKEIKGTQIEVLASDPSNPVEGQVWYNSTSNVLKGSVRTTAGAWATGGSLNTGRRAMGGAGTQTAALGIGGNSNPGSPPYDVKLAITESYNGTNWTEVNDLNTARGYAARGSGGIQTSALYFGGKSSPGPAGDALTETWNGSNWTEVNNLNTARYNNQGAGADNTSALSFGGTPNTAVTESWNGTNWTEVNDLNTARSQIAGFGIATSAIAATGEDPSGRVKITELWNGTNWTEVNDTNADRSGAGAAGAVNTAGLIFGGFESSPVDSNVGKTETWNGTNWTEEADLSGPVYYQQQTGAGTASSAISFGGEGSSNQMRTATEEWTGAGAPVTRTFTDS